MALCIPLQAAAQSPLPQMSALPAVPYWWRAPQRLDFEALPLAWYNDLDGLVVGAAARWQLSSATVWSGLGFGLKGEGGAPAGFEAVAEVPSGNLSFRSLHGRDAFALQFLDLWRIDRVRVSAAVSAVGLSDDRYLETVPLFECPAEAPSVPCEEVPTPYGWSDGRDHALEAGVSWGEVGPGTARVDASLTGGLEVVGGDHAYVRAEAQARKSGALGPGRWSARLAAGWASGRTPQQRRFRLDGAGSITRWLNPYLEAEGAVLADVPYFVPGGGHLRAYEDTRPLVKSYLGVSGAVSRERALPHGFWGSIAAFGEAAWTPGLPDLVGPEDLTPDSRLLFDWRELPPGEGNELGEFRARVLDVPAIWADAGLALTGGFRRVAVTVSLPFWASAPAFAGESVLDDEKRAFALRWTLTISVFAADLFLAAKLQEE